MTDPFAIAIIYALSATAFMLLFVLSDIYALRGLAPHRRAYGPVRLWGSAAFIVSRMSPGAAVLTGALYGLLLYWINFYVFTRWFPWFAGHRDWIAVGTHLIQGALWGGLYKAWERRVATTTG